MWCYYSMVIIHTFEMIQENLLVTDISLGKLQKSLYYCYFSHSVPLVVLGSDGKQNIA